MFGQDDTQQPASQVPPADTGALSAAMPDPLSVGSTATPPAGFSLPTPSPDTSAAPATADDASAPELPGSSLSMPTIPDPASTTAPASNPSNPVPVSDDLLSIKQQALDQLSPLVSHLDQTPEEKFRTTMMMIQASDNKDLIKDAFDAAQQINDEKARAQALLDVINEINYFSQKEDQQAE
jgi:hypothetical protein